MENEQQVDGRVLKDRRLRSQGEEAGVTTFSSTDEWMRVVSTWELEKQATLWRFPLETVSLSESGFERLYQGSILMPFWDLDLAAQGEASSQWTIRIKQSLSMIEQ